MFKYFITALVALCWVPGAASATSALATVSCGETVTHSIRLANDLTDCHADGLVIGADGITVDLADHTIDGDGLPAAEGLDVGIRDAGHVHVTIEGGVVQQFDRGVRLEGASDNRLDALAVRDSSGRNIELVDGSNANRIDHNTSSGSPRSAIALVSSDGNVVQHNLASHNHVGIFLTAGSDDNRVEGNTASDTEDAGLDVEDGDRNTLIGNRMVHDVGAIIVTGDDNVVRRNRIDDVVACEGCGFGISMEGGSRNLVSENTVSEASHIGIRLDSFDHATTGNTIRDNVVRDAGDFGIAIDPEDAGPVLDTLVEGNVAIGAGDDGINVATPDTTVTSNRALHNGDLGIEAVAGVTDGGGNRAFGNGNPVQCTNVFCK
jgi:parallel beta-helix repeat protein